MFVYSVLSVVAEPRFCDHCEMHRADADSADSPPQILIYLHYFNGAIVGGCPLSYADPALVHRALGNVPVHKCISWPKLRTRSETKCPKVVSF